MNRANSDRPVLRFLAEAVEHFQGRTSPAEIARRLDLSCSTISRERKDKPIMSWAFAEVITLAKSDELLSRQVHEFLDGGQTGTANGSAARFAADMATEVRATAELHATVLLARGDGRLDATERAAIRQLILDRQNTDAAMLRDLDAMDAREGVRA